MITGLELLQEIADRIKWPQPDTLEDVPMRAETRKMVRALNRVLKTLQALDDWPLLRTDGTIVTVAEVVGTASEYVTATQGSDTITIAGDAFLVVHKGWAFQVGADDHVYRVKDVVSPTVIQINRAWINDSITVSDERTFELAMDRYALPTDFDRPLDDMKSFLAPYDIEAVSPEEFRRLRLGESGIVTNNPREFTIYGMDDGQTSMLLHLNPYPTKASMLQFSYMQIHPDINSDNDKVLFPKTYHSLIIDAVIQITKRDYDDEVQIETLIVDIMKAYNQRMMNPMLTQARPQIQAENSVRGRVRRAYGNRGKVDYGSHWDIVGFNGN